MDVLITLDDIDRHVAAIFDTKVMATRPSRPAGVAASRSSR